MEPQGLDGDRLSTNITVNLRGERLRDRDLMGHSDSFAVLYLDSRVPVASVDGVQRLQGIPAPQPPTPGGVRDPRWERIGSTDTLNNNCNPRWATSFEIPYFFERAQRIAVDVYDRDAPGDDLSQQDFLGTAECAVPSLIRAQGKRLQLPLTDVGHPTLDCGTLTLVAEEQSALNEEIEMEVEVHGLVMGLFSREAPSLIISRPSEGSNVSEDGVLTPTRTSGAAEWIVVRDPVSSRPMERKRSFVFDSFAVNYDRLCFGDDRTVLQIDVVTKKGSVASALVSLDQWRSAGTVQLNPPTDVSVVPSPRRRRPRKQLTSSWGRALGSLTLRRCEQVTKHAFLDYVFAGYEIALAIAIDFTASNGDPTSPGSLHYLDQHNPNEYELAIHSVGEILAQYDRDQHFPGYGFGAKLPPAYRFPSHCFALTGAEDATCVGITGVLEAYRQTLYNVRFSGPTVFAEIIQAAAGYVRTEMEKGAQVYTIMLIITDGVINDMDDTINEIVKASALPLSIVIVGVGDADFTDMNVLDGDQGLLAGRAVRDIVQFVPFRRYQGAPEVLTAKVLEEIPGQVRDTEPSIHNVFVIGKRTSSDIVVLVSFGLDVFSFFSTWHAITYLHRYVRTMLMILASIAKKCLDVSPQRIRECRAGCKAWDSLRLEDVALAVFEGEVVNTVASGDCFVKTIWDI